MNRDWKFPSAESDRPVHKALPERPAFLGPWARRAQPEVLAQLDRLVRRDLKDRKALLGHLERNGFPVWAPRSRAWAIFSTITSM